MLSRTTTRFAMVLFWVTIVLSIAIAATGVWLIVAPEAAMAVFAQTIPTSDGVVPAAFRVLTVAWWVSLLLGLLLLWHMGSLFHAFGQGQTLGPRVLHHVKGAGFALLMIFVYRLILRPLEGLILMLMSPPEYEGQLTISFSSQDITLALGGILLLMLGRVLIEAQQAADENRAFV